ncbi:hypothetical protein CP061683_0079B, partial [Chlamydia psittaci 06-1683]
EES